MLIIWTRKREERTELLPFVSFGSLGEKMAQSPPFFTASLLPLRHPHIIQPCHIYRYGAQITTNFSQVFSTQTYARTQFSSLVRKPDFSGSILGGFKGFSRNRRLGSTFRKSVQYPLVHQVKWVDKQYLPHWMLNPFWKPGRNCRSGS